MTTPRRRRVAAALALLFLVGAAPQDNPGVKPLVERLRAVGREGAGNAEAGSAWRELMQAGPGAMPALLDGMDGASDAAANWLRAAVDALGEKALAAGRPLPVGQLESFVLQTRHNPAARRLAYEWLTRVDATASARLLPNMLHDPSVELRRDAVARVLGEAEGLLTRGERGAATQSFQKALAGARDRDQVDQIAKRLKELGSPVDLPAHFGFLTTWQLVGPFDSTKGVGFAAVYDPEKGVRLDASYKGKNGKEVRWVEHATPDPYGVVDLNKALGKNMGAVAYAFAAVRADRERPIEIRAGSNNAVKIYLNGQLVHYREEYHHGNRMDQHVGRGTLKAGRNEILVKVCQNEQTDDWAQSWSFQLRVCDAVGSAVQVTRANATEKKP